MLLLLPESVARAASPEGVIVIAVIYAILTIVGQIKKAASRGKQPPPRPVPRRQPPIRQEPARPQRSLSAPARRLPTPDTQAEAQRLEKLLRGLAGLPDEGPMGRRSGTPLPSAEAAENTESLEVDREPVDQDAEAEAVAQRRIQAAMARNRPLTDADHAAFDKQLRSAEVTKPVVRKAGSRDRLRNAMIWREILGPPGGLQD